MSKTVVKRDKDGKLQMRDGKPVLEDVPDGTPTESVNGYRVAMSQEDIDQRRADAEAAGALARRTKAERIEQDVLPQADFLTDPVLRAVVLELLALQGVAATDFIASVRARLEADPDLD